MPTQSQIDEKAAALYHAAAPCHPAWDQLGEVTRSVWRARVQPASPPPAPAKKPAKKRGSAGLLW